jgi:hypothetical protein
MRSMSVEWQGDHKLLDASGEKQDFEHALTQLGLDPSKFLVEVRRDSPGAGGREPLRYEVYVTDLEHLDRETWKLRGGQGENWITDFVRSHRR